MSLCPTCRQHKHDGDCLTNALRLAQAYGKQVRYLEGEVDRLMKLVGERRRERERWHEEKG